MKRIYQLLMSAVLCVPTSASASEMSTPMHLLTDDDTCIVINEVVVTGLTGTAKMKDTPMPITLVTQRDLQNQAFSNIIDAVAAQPGVAQISTGSGISKPVIRGLGYNRVVVVNDNVRQEGQQWGDEHGVEIDPQTVGSVEILKGPASLRYGSDAIAGVMIFHPQALLPRDSVAAMLNSEYQTNSGLLDYSLSMAGNNGGIDWNWRYSEKLAHAYKNRNDGYVLGSQYHERALSGLLGLRRSWGSSRLRLSYYQLMPGLVEGERDELTGQFLKETLVDGEVDEVVASSHDLKTYGHGLPYQRIGHFKAVSDNAFYIHEGTLRAIFAYQNNRRREYEEVEHPHQAGLDFLLHTLNYDVHYHLPEVAGWRIVSGVGGMYQRSANRGEEYLIPAYNLFDAGFFATASRDMGKLHLSGGARYDYRHLHSYALMDEGEPRFADFQRHFTGMTGSLGAAYNLSSRINLRANLARGFRAPNMSELGSNGIHEGTLRYEIGNSALDPEFSTQMDLGLDYSSHLLNLQLSLFSNWISNYIFARRAILAEEIVLGDGKMVYEYAQGNARLTGGELLAELHPLTRVHFENSFSWVRGVQRHQPLDRKYLPYMPAPRWTSKLRIDVLQHQHSLRNAYVSAALQCYLRQNHFYEADQTETATPSYTLVNLAAGTDIVRKGRRLLTLTLAVDNLFDRAYQSHLSRLKYAPVNPVTGRRGIYNPGRNMTVKLALPIL